MPKGAFFITLDRGASWSGPYSLGTLLHHPELEGMEITTRTCYHLESSGSLAVLLSARPIKGQGLGIDSDKTFLARTNDCVEWTFAGWLIPRTDPYRAVRLGQTNCRVPTFQPVATNPPTFSHL